MRRPSVTVAILGLLLTGCAGSLDRVYPPTEQAREPAPQLSAKQQEEWDLHLAQCRAEGARAAASLPAPQQAPAATATATVNIGQGSNDVPWITGNGAMDAYYKAEEAARWDVYRRDRNAMARTAIRGCMARFGHNMR